MAIPLPIQMNQWPISIYFEAQRMYTSRNLLNGKYNVGGDTGIDQCNWKNTTPDQGDALRYILDDTT